MKVLVGGKLYDAREEPIVIILSHEDRENIANMHEDKSKFIVFPEDMSSDMLDDILEKIKEIK